MGLVLTQCKGSAVGARGARIALEGRITIEGESLDIEVGLDEDFPLSLPIVILRPGDALGFVPHVARDGYVCYAETEGLVLDHRNPAAIVEEALARSRSVLTRGVRGENKWDFVEEFGAYWRRLEHTVRIVSLVEPGPRVREIKAFKRGHKKYALLSDDISPPQGLLDGADLARCSHKNALYVPFSEGSYVQPPGYNTFWTIKTIQRIVRQNLSPQNLRELERLAKKGKYEEIVVFGLPGSGGHMTLFGISFIGAGDKHPLLGGGPPREMTPLVLERFDREYLLPRGGANNELHGKRIALIGCGSVGGFVASQLASAGVLRLTLIDPEDLSPENTFRHLLGKDAWSEPKVDAIKAEIERKLPFVAIETIAEKAEKALGVGDFVPSDYDLIVVALGDESVSLYLNEAFHSRGGTPPVVYTWLEPYGIGGHALVTGNSDEGGCFECLFTPVSSEGATLQNRAAFAAGGQAFTRDLLGCSNPFIPYGSADAVQTSLLASRLTIDVLSNKVTGNPVLSWKGNAKAFLQAGLKLSDRYSLTQEKLLETRYAYQNPDCPVCGLSE